MEELGIILPVDLNKPNAVAAGARLAEEHGYTGVYVPESLAATPDSLAMAGKSRLRVKPRYFVVEHQLESWLAASPNFIPTSANSETC